MQVRGIPATPALLTGSELAPDKHRSVAEILTQLRAQVFITGITLTKLTDMIALDQAKCSTWNKPDSTQSEICKYRNTLNSLRGIPATPALLARLHKRVLSQDNFSYSFRLLRKLHSVRKILLCHPLQSSLGGCAGIPLPATSTLS